MIVPADHTAGKHSLRWCFYEDRQIGKKETLIIAAGSLFLRKSIMPGVKKKARRKAERMKKKAGLAEKH